jgi:hypothetical protein
VVLPFINLACTRWVVRRFSCREGLSWTELGGQGGAKGSNVLGSVAAAAVPSATNSLAVVEVAM